MAKSPLLRRASAPNAQGRVHHITPKSARWTYVGFEVFYLKKGEKLAKSSGNKEICAVLLSGKAIASVLHKGKKHSFGEIGERKSEFEGSPWSLYAPSHANWTLEATTDVEIAVCAAPATGKLPPRVISPGECGQETRGKGSNTRYVRNILPDTGVAESLLVVEVITPGGNWSSYPPHKHDQDNLPHESLLEETYYHRFNPSQGYGVQRVYTEDRSLDETILIQDRDVVLVPKGYHPVGAAHGYDLFYLNVMAGPKKVWKFHNDPDHEWLMAK